MLRDRADATLRDLPPQLLRDPPRRCRRVTLSASAYRAARRRLPRASARGSPPPHGRSPLCASRRHRAPVVRCRCARARTVSHRCSLRACAASSLAARRQSLSVRRPLRVRRPRSTIVSSHDRWRAKRPRRRGARSEPAIPPLPTLKSFTNPFVRMKQGPSCLSRAEEHQKPTPPQKPLLTNTAVGGRGGHGRRWVGSSTRAGYTTARGGQLF